MLAISESAYGPSLAALDGIGDSGATRERLQALQQRINDAEAAHPDHAASGAGDALSLRAQTRQDIAAAFDVLARDNGQAEQRRDALRQALGNGRIGVALLSGISLLALFFYLRQTRALKARQRREEELVTDDRDRLEREVVLRTAQLTELTRHLQTAREDERHRLARDLHDELGALLTSAKLDGARIKSRLAGSAPDALERLDHLVGTLNSIIALKRRIVEDLRPSSLSHLGLRATLEIQAREFTERAEIPVHCLLDEVHLTPAAELVAYRLVQEAITNISKYAQAQQVWIHLSERDGRVELTVRDDGIGFDTTLPRASAHGLLGMRFRVEAESGTLVVVSAPGTGTVVQASLPAAPSDLSAVAIAEPTPESTARAHAPGPARVVPAL